MTILEHTPAPDEILDFVEKSVGQLAETGVDARYILVGTAAYEHLRKAISVRTQRGKGLFESYNHIPIVVDPFRVDAVCVVPGPPDMVDGVQPFRIPTD